NFIGLFTISYLKTTFYYKSSEASSREVASILFAAITNGVQIAKETIIATSVTIGARQSAPVAKKDIKNGGVTQATCTETGFTKPKYVAKYPIATEITGAIKNGTNSIAFRTTGIPNSIGSLMLKIPGPTDSLATVR